MIRAVVALALALVGTARAEEIELPKTRVKLHLADGWTQPKTVPAGLVAAATTGDAGVLAVTRARVPNADAWRGKTRDAYLDDIERGIAATIPGYRRTSKTLGVVGEVPVLDVTATRAGGAQLAIRVLAFRTYALALAIEMPKLDAGARDMIKRFAPP